MSSVLGRCEAWKEDDRSIVEFSGNIPRLRKASAPESDNQIRDLLLYLII
jgi:hypothetical protein